MEGQRLGKYEVLGRIGRGAVGVVYKGWDPILERSVAIKVVPKRAIEDREHETYVRFQQEARAAGRLHHPNIVSTFDYGEASASAFIVMELLPGPSLQAVIQQQKRLDFPEITRVMRGLLAGLQHSHSRNVVHRDIKPANIVFAEDGTVKITDFGIAHLESSSLTLDGTQVGTPAYMAPEQVTGDRVDGRSDLYAAGVVLFEMLTGRRPFEGSTSSIMHQIVFLPPPRPSQFVERVPSGLDAVLAVALAKAPDARYQSASDFAAAIERATESKKPSKRNTKISPVAEIDPIQGQRRVQWVGPAVNALLGPPDARRSRARLLGGILVAVVTLSCIAGFVRYHSADQPANHQSGIAPAFAPSRVDNIVAGALKSAPCTFFTATMTETGLRLNGITALGEASSMAVQSLVRGVIARAMPNLAVTWDLRRFEGPYCSALAVLQSIRGEARSSGPSVAVSLGNGAAGGGGRSSGLTVTAPDFPASVLVDLFTNDGMVLHLDLGRTLAAARSTTAIRGQAIEGPPGAALLTAIAASTPLLMGQRPDRELASAYLGDLKSALDRTGGDGTRIAVDARVIDMPQK